MVTKDGQDDETQLLDQFSRDGFVCIRQALPVDALNDWQGTFSELWSFLFQKLFDHGHTSFPTDSRYITDTNEIKYALGLGVKNGFREVVMRSPGRYELSLLNHEWFKGRGGLDMLEQLKNQLDSIIPLLLGKSTWNDVSIANLSFVVSTPGASMQGWHADGGHVSLEEHKPCHCFNVFIPLQDMPSMEWGPTELRPGSHYYTRNLAPMLLAAKCRKQLRPTQAPLLELGDVLVFDYRILHRGLANTTKHQNRAVLVLTVCEPWFEDRLNFPKNSLYMSAEGDGFDSEN